MKKILLISFLLLTMPLSAMAVTQEETRTNGTFQDDQSIEMVLESEELDDLKVKFSWNEYEEDDFKWYKLVTSTDTERPVYPDHKTVTVIEDRTVTEAETKFPAGKSYFRVCVITQDDRRGCSNTITLEREMTEEELANKQDKLENRVEAKQLFRDHLNHWAKLYIERLANKGIIDSNQENFRPDDSINRAEAIKMIILASGLHPDNCDETIFPDLQSSDWFCKVVTLAHAKGYLEGEQGRLNPTALINRAQAIKLVLMAKAVTIDLNNMTDTGFEDVPSQEWFAKYVYYGKKLGLLQGKKVNGRHIFDPAAPITRAELAKILDLAFYQ